MQCPHCLGEFDAKPHSFALGQDQDGTWEVTSTRCPVCDRLIVNFCTKEGCVYPGRPALFSRARLSDDVPAELAVEYHTAAQVLPYSPEASAAISRRLLHRFLEDFVGATGGTLLEQMEAATTSCALPSYLKGALDTLAQAAKLTENEGKSTHPEALAPTKPGEPEWLLDVLEQFFELYFVQPARLQRKRARLEEQVGPLLALAEASPQPFEEPETGPFEEAAVPGEALACAGTEGAPAAGQMEEPAAPDVGSQATPRVEPETAPAATEATAQPAQANASPADETDRGGWRRLTGR